MITPRKLALSAALATALFSSPSPAATLYSESFDSSTTAKVDTFLGSDAEGSFVDYSNFTVGTVAHGLPEAPRQISGSPASKGYLMKFRYASTPTLDQRLVNLIAKNATNTARLNVTGNYRMSVDMYLSMGPTTGNGTTETGIWGVGWDGQRPMGRGTRGDTLVPRIVGTYGWITTDGGFGSEDAAIRLHPTGTTASTAFFKGDTTSAALFTSAWPTAAPISKNPNNSWTRVDIDVASGWVFVRYNGFEFFRQQSAMTAGQAVIGYEDPNFGSASFAPNYQWAIFDNWTIEEIPPLSLLVTQSQSIPTLFATGGSSNGQLKVENLTSQAIDITGAQFGGDFADDFALLTSLPITIPVAGSANVDITFSPQTATNGERRTILTFDTTSTVTPQVSTTEIVGNLAVPAFLQAHYKLDESSGVRVTDSSEQRLHGGYQVRDPLSYAQPPLSPTLPGTSVGLVPANLSTTGCYITSPVSLAPSFSISMWFKPTGPAATVGQALFQRATGFTSIDNIYGCVIAPDGALLLNIAKASSTDPVVMNLPPATIAQDQTYHLVVTHEDTDGLSNGTAVRTAIYLNGQLAMEKLAADTKGFADYPTGTASNVKSLYFGTRSAAGNGFAGLMDDIQIYGVPLDATQVTSLYQNPGLTVLDIQNHLPAITHASRSSESGPLTINFTALTGRSYKILGSTTLESTSWQEVATGLVGTYPTTQAVITSLTNGQRAYFKAVSQ